MDELDQLTDQQLAGWKSQNQAVLDKEVLASPEKLDALSDEELTGLKQRQHEVLLAPFREQARAGQGAYSVSEGVVPYLGRQFVSPIRSLAMGPAYGVAKDRLNRNEHSDSDLRAIAAYEHEQGLDQAQPEWAKWAGVAAAAPGTVAEFGLAPGLSFAAHAGAGAIAQGGLNAESLLKGGAQAAVQVGVLKSLGPIAKTIFPQAEGILATAGTHALTGSVGLALADYGTKLAGLSESGGPIGEALAGHYGEAARGFVANAVLTFGTGAFGAIQKGYSKKVATEKAVENVQKVAEQAATGAVQEEARSPKLKIGDTEVLTPQSKDLNPAERYAVDKYGENKVLRVGLNGPDGPMGSATLAEEGDTIHVAWVGKTGLAGGEGRGKNLFGAREVFSLATQLAEAMPDAKFLKYTVSEGRIGEGKAKIVDLDAIRRRGQPKAETPEAPTLKTGASEPRPEPYAAAEIEPLESPPTMSADEARGWLAFNGLKAPESDAVAIAKAEKLVAEAKAKGAVGVKRPTGEAPPEGPSAAEQVGAKQASVGRFAGMTPEAAERSRRYLESLGPEPPPPEAGMVRLYRGTKTGEIPHEHAFFTDESGLAGVAVPFARVEGRNLSYVDVPAAVAKAGHIGDETGASEYKLPKEYRRRIKTWGKGPSGAESLAVRSSGGLEKTPAENLADSVEDAVGRMVEDMASGPYYAHEQSRIMSAWRTVRAAAAKSGGTFAEYADPQWVAEHVPRDAGQVNRAIATIAGYHRTLNQRYGGWEPPEGWDPTAGTSGPRTPGLTVPEETGVQNRMPALPPAPSDPLADAYRNKGITKRDQRLHQAAIAGEDSLRSAARKEGLSPEGVRKAIKRVDEKVGQEFSAEAMRAKEKAAREELHRGGVEVHGEEPAAKPRPLTAVERQSKKLDDLGDLIMRQAEQGKLSPEAMARHKAEADRIAGVEALKEARQAGIPPEHVEAMADDILAEHKESIREWQSLYRDAYDALKEFGVTPQKLHGILTRAAKDPASIKGMDEVAQDLAEKYPSFFRLKTEHASDTLASILLKGKPQSMTVAEARETAADRLAKNGVDGATKAALRSGDTQADVAESIRRGKEASDAELSAGQAQEGASEGGEFAFGAEPDPARVAALMKQGFNRSAAEERATLEAAKQQHPQQAMGAAALGELTGQAEQRTNPRLTALAHAQGDIERENLDLGPAPARGGYSFERVNAAAEAAIRADPQLPGKILAELERKLRPLDAVETVVVEHEKVRLNNHLDRLNSVLEMGDAIDQAEYRREQLDTLNQIERLMDLTDRAGSEAGGAFVLRQQLMAEDYSFVGLTRRAAAAKGSPLTTEERAQFEKMAQEISRLQTKLAAFERPDSPQAADVRVELNRAKRTAKQTIGDLKLANLPIPQRVFRGGMEMLDASRALMTSMDFSAVLRQGGFLAFGHPVVTAKALPEMFRATISEHQAALARDAIEQRPNSLLYKRAGLYLADPHAPLSAQEESFAGRWVKKIPGIAASERAYTTVLNRVRADVFDAMISSEAAKGQVSDNAASALANFVNIASGRGSLGGLERAGTTLARIFFSPRFVASRFQLVAGSPLWGGTMSTRQAIIKEYARTAIGLGVFYGAATMAAQALGAKKDEFALSFDPRSADFGKIKMGNTRIDPLFGLAQTIVLEGRAATGQTKSTKTGEVTSLSNPKFGQSSFTDVLSRFIRSKLAPIPGALIDLREGKNVVGQPATLGSKAQELVTPIAVEDVVKAIKEQGVPTGLATGLAAIFGMGVQVYEKKQAAAPVGRR